MPAFINPLRARASPASPASPAPVRAAADRRRQELLKQVQGIKSEFEQLRSQVARWPEAARPGPEAWEVDSQLRQLSDEKAAALEEQVGIGAASWAGFSAVPRGLRVCEVALIASAPGCAS